MALALGLALGLGGCGGGNDGRDGAPGSSGSAGISTLLEMATEPVGSNCANGGTKVSAGLDANVDTFLDAGEISNVRYVCTGVDGSAGTAGSTGGPGATGATGATGAAGATGSSGVASLIAIVSEPAGPNCAAGGSKATAGPDTDHSGVLDAGEVTGTGYACNGAAGVPATGSWVEVTTLTAAAQPNTGYLANNASQVVVTLPASSSIGDVVQVTGLGAGGWKIAQQAGQSIITQGLSGGTTGTPRADARSWSAMAASADGTRLVAAAGSSPIHTSTDSGATWTAGTTASSGWSGVASSADGMVLAAVANGGSLITSTDAGANWTIRDSNRNWTGVALSADGSKMVALAFGAQVYTSADLGTSWTARDSVRSWTGVASSADGTLLVAAVSNGLLYTSSDSGLTWTGRATSRNWRGLASSADGSKLLASVGNGSLYTSTDAGVTWTAREASRDWRGVSSSTDGTHLLASAYSAGSTGALYSSTDGGLTWSSRQGGVTTWTAVAMNDIGTRLFAAANGGNIYTFTTRTTTGTAGSVSGGQYDSIALQYAGGGVFLPISSVKYSGVFIVE